MRYGYSKRFHGFRALMALCLLGIAMPVQATPAGRAAPGNQGVVARTAEADRPGSASRPRKPCGKPSWYCGVSKSQQRSALALYREGNALFDDSLFLSAVKRYRAALEHWDHPSIHYNLMLALVALDRPVEAYESSAAALRHGSKALKREEYHRARDYQTLLRGRIAVLEVSCDEPGAVVSVDGKPLFKAPGRARALVLPGRHEVVATKANYLTSHQTFLLMPDEPKQVHVSMLPADQAMITVRHWPGWRSWAVVGAGVGLSVLGAALERQASVDNHAYRTLFAKECFDPEGCELSDFSSALLERRKRYRRYRRLGHGALAAGATSVLAGMVLVYLNWPEQIKNPERRNLFRVSMSPSVLPDSASLSVQVDF